MNYKRTLLTLDKPSNIITAIKAIDDNTPRTEERESTESGRKTVGRNLCWDVKN